MLNNGIKYQKLYSFQKEYKSKIYNNIKTNNTNEYNNVNPNANEKEQNLMKSLKVLKCQKSEDNLNKKIMTKRVF